MESKLVKLILSEIIQGYSAAKYNGQTIFFKHLGLMSLTDSEQEYEKYYAQAIENDIATREVRLAQIIEEGLWTTQLEEELAAQGEAIKNQTATKKAVTLASQVKELNDEIIGYERRRLELLIQKSNVMGLIAEDIASQKSNEKYIFLTLYKNKELTEPFFSLDDYNDLEVQQINKITQIYNETFTKFSNDALGWAGFSLPFQKYYTLCGDKPELFFGRPIFELSFYQVELLNEGKSFHYIVTNNTSLPDSASLHDPEKLKAWHEASNRSQNMKQELNKPGNNMIMGATKEDFAAAGIKGQTQAEMLAAKGGRMGMADLE